MRSRLHFLSQSKGISPDWNNRVGISLPYTAKDDGMVYLTGYKHIGEGIGTSTFSVYVNGKVITSCSDTGNETPIGDYSTVFIPVNKGDIISVSLRGSARIYNPLFIPYK